MLTKKKKVRNTFPSHADILKWNSGIRKKCILVWLTKLQHIKDTNHIAHTVAYKSIHFFKRKK